MVRHGFSFSQYSQSVGPFFHPTDSTLRLVPSLALPLSLSNSLLSTVLSSLVPHNAVSGDMAELVVRVNSNCVIPV